MRDFSFLDLVKAYKDCRRAKRNTLNAIEFEFNLERNLIELYGDLKSGEYEIGESECFIVLKPKPREVWAASFRDRVVHHLVYNAICERFYRRFICDTYSCIPERGALNGAKKLAKYVQAVTENYTKEAYFLKADIKNFFVSIDKNILFRLLCRYVEEEWIVELLRKIVFDNPKERAVVKSPKKKFEKLPKHKSLWNTSNDKGLPIGNLTSQFFSNVYLDVLDEYVKRELKCRYYCRYVDDFVILDRSAERLNEIHRKITEFLRRELSLELHQDKRLINKTYLGIDFVGYKIKHGRIYLREHTMKRIFRLYGNLGEINEKKFMKQFRAMNSYLGFLQCVNGYKLRRRLCEMSVKGGFDCDREFRKVFVPEHFGVRG